MTVATVLPLATAFVGVLDSLPAGCSAYLAGAPDGAVAPYVVVYPDSGEVEQISLVLDEGLVGYFFVHGVGSGPEQALWALDEARKLLVGARPAVSGRNVYRIWQEPTSPPLLRDDDIRPPVYAAVAEFGMRSDPA